MKKHYRKENDCANCGAELQGKFCHKCGQENLELKENFGHMMTHAISDYFHFDHQFFHTIRPLFLQPGKLTLEYMAGKRMQYLHPVKMYIFISLVYFLLLFKSGHDEAKEKHQDNEHTKTELTDNNKQLDSVLKDPNVPSYVKPLIEMEKKDNEAGLKSSVKHDDNDDESKKVTTKMTPSLPGATKDSTYDAYLANQSKLAEKDKDGYFFRAYNKKSFEYRDKYGKNARQMFFDDVKHNIPKMMFLLLPICALIFKISFWNNKKYYVEHLIFTFHLHCFIFLFLAILLLLEMVVPKSWVIGGWLEIVRLIGVVWYLYRALRVFYQRSRWRTISKIIGATTMYFIAFGLCVGLIGVITAVL